MLTRLTAVAVLVLVVLLCLAAPALAAEGPEGSHGGHQESHPGGNDALNPVTADGYNFRGDLSVWTAVVFLVVLAILAKFAWGPISEGLLKRESGIAGQIAEAQRKHEEARQLLADYEKKLAAAQEEVRALIEQGRRDSEKIGQQLVEKAREEASIERQRAVQQIESATSAALKDLADRSATLAVELAGKILGAQLKPADHNRLIEQAVAEFARSGPAKVNGNTRS